MQEKRDCVRCWPCTAERASRARIAALLDHFVLTFVAQMGVMALAFHRFGQATRAKGMVSYSWLALWCLYAVGLAAKGLERPLGNAQYGHHEALSR